MAKKTVKRTVRRRCFMERCESQSLSILDEWNRARVQGKPLNPKTVGSGLKVLTDVRYGWRIATIVSRVQPSM